VTAHDNSGRPDIFPLLGFDDLERLPDPPWLIDGLVPGNGLSVLYGPSGAGKSFLALDWAMSVAAGLPWFDHAIAPRIVVYIAAEGSGGLLRRATAWWRERGRPDVSRIRWLPEAVNLLEPTQVERARRTLATLPERPGLVVVDTAARTMVGGDENAAKDVGRFIASVDALREADAALVVHHTGKDGGSERGSSALRGAADLMVKADRDGRRVKLTCDKLKEAAEWSPLTLQLEPTAGSCVLSLTVEAATPDDLAQRVLAYIDEHGPTSQNDVERNVRGRNADVRAAVKALELAGDVHRIRDGLEVRPGRTGTHRTQANGGGASRAGEEDVVLPAEDAPHAQPAEPRPDTAPDDLGAEVFDLVARAERLAAEHADIAEAGS
jgi:hypothetical protein